MKTKFICVFLFFCTFLFAQEFYLKTTKDILISDYNSTSKILADTVLEVEKFGGNDVKIHYGGNSIWLKDVNSIIPLGMTSFFEKNMLSNFLDDNSKDWIDIRYYEPLLQNNRKILLEYFPYLNTREYQWAHEVNGYVPEWYERGLTNAYNYTWVIYNFSIADWMGLWVFPVLNIQKIKNGYSVNAVNLIAPDNISDMHTKINYDWSKIPNKEIFNLILMIDGDYMDIYIEDTDTHFATLVHVSKNSVEQLDKLIQTNTCDLSNITWPRRADKNHTVGTTCIVAESLRLRKEENTTSATLQTMQPGTRVQILQLGKKQTINGITANWVQVEVVDASLKESPEEDLSNSVSTSEQGADVRGAIGWCFGGYLVEK